jgi:transcriptional regulator with XRE-family HTH domain
MARIGQVPADPISQFRLAFGAAVREARLAAGMTQDDLAGRAGIDRKTVSRLETGAYAPAFDRLLPVAVALEVRLSQLMKTAEAAMDSSGR